MSVSVPDPGLRSANEHAGKIVQASFKTEALERCLISGVC
jgi:hypothetical protein